MAEPTDDNGPEQGARAGFAAESLSDGKGTMQGARMGFGTGSFGAPEEVPADTVMQRPPNLVLNQSNVADTPLPSDPEASVSLTPAAASLALSTTPPLVVVSAFEALQERIRFLEITLSRMPPPPAGLGHNNPPEPIEDLPLSAAEWREIRQSLATLKEQAIVPAREPKEAEAAASILKVIGEKILSFLGRRAEEFSSEFAKKAGAAAGEKAVYAAFAGLLVLAYYGEPSLKSVATDLIEVHNLIEAWVHSLGY